jgi:hypothetical protein
MGNEIIRIVVLCVQLSWGSATNVCVTRTFSNSCGYTRRIESNRIKMTKTKQIQTRSSCINVMHWTPSVTFTKRDETSRVKLIFCLASHSVPLHWQDKSVFLSVRQCRSAVLCEAVGVLLNVGGFLVCWTALIISLWQQTNQCALASSKRINFRATF